MAGRAPKRRVIQQGAGTRAGAPPAPRRNTAQRSSASGDVSRIIQQGAGTRAGATPAPRRDTAQRSSASGDVSRIVREGDGQVRKFAIIAARFNERITKRLVDGAASVLASHGIPPRDVEVCWVPGSFELPQAAGHLAATGRYAAIVCVGVVIRGQTPHFEHVAREAASGIQHVALTSGVPATFGVVTALSEEQAWDRAGGEVGNRGEEAAEAALEMAEFVARVAKRGKTP